MDNSEEFYLVLPSNSSMIFFPDNTISCFTTHLSREIRLTGDWQVGLAEIHIPCTMMHFQSKEAYYRFELSEINDNKSGFIYSISPGMYESIEQLAAEINNHANVAEHQLLQPSKHKKGFYSIYRQCKCDQPHSTVFNDKIKHIFGLEGKYFQENKSFTTYPNAKSILNGTRPASLSRAIPDQLYVYTDICEARIVGDTQAALLRIVSLDTIKYKFGANIVRQFAPIHYIPLLQHSFQHVVIDIRDQHGQHMPFTSGTSIITLHFRRRQ